MDRITERCAKHGLAVRPDGTCILCAGGIPEPAPEPDPSPHVLRFIKGGVAVLVVLLAFAIGYRAVAPLIAHSLDLDKDLETERVRRKRLSNRPKPTATARTEPTASEVRAARRAVHVVLYTQRDCEYCRRARDYMRAENIDFEERFIDRDPEAAAALEALDPDATVPTIDVEGDVMHGFNEHELERRIDRAARHRL